MSRCGTAGCYGRVFVGKWKEATVALKIVDEFEETVEDNAQPAEASLLDGIDHPFLVRLMAHKTTEQRGKRRLWLVTEFCNRGSLHVSLRSPPPFQK